VFAARRSILVNESAFVRILAVALLAFLAPADAICEKDHYEFILPDHYVGWVQVIFNDHEAPFQSHVGKAWFITVSEDGIFRTRSIRVMDLKPADTFFYRIALPDGSSRLEAVPKNYVLKEVNDGGFDVAGTNGKGIGRSWYVFIGPPELRSKTRFADWSKEVDSRMRMYGTADLGPPDPLPIPGRITAGTSSEQ
jgi:hypothetical protein